MRSTSLWQLVDKLQRTGKIDNFNKLGGSNNRITQFSLNFCPYVQPQLAPRGSLLISLCNQCMAQQLQVIILKADGIPSKSAVSLAGSGRWKIKVRENNLVRRNFR